MTICKICSIFVTSVLVWSWLGRGISSAEPPKQNPHTPLYATNTPQGYKARQEEYVLRTKDRNRFFNSARRLVQKAKVQKFADLYNFAVEHAQQALPTPGNCVLVEDAKKQPAFALVILLEKDSSLGDPWKDLFSKEHASALYEPSLNTMILCPKLSGSEEHMGMQLLHEVFHAREHLRDGKNARTPEEYCEGEVHAHECIGEMVQILHPKLRGLISSVEKQLDALPKQDIRSSVENTQIFRYIGSKLHSVYGREITNPHEKSALTFDVLFLAEFARIDRDPLSLAEARKIQWLKHYMEMSNLAQWKR